MWRLLEAALEDKGRAARRATAREHDGQQTGRGDAGQLILSEPRGGPRRPGYGRRMAGGFAATATSKRMFTASGTAGRSDIVAFKQLILREVSRQEGHPHWVNIRSTRSRQVRSLEASAGWFTQG